MAVLERDAARNAASGPDFCVTYHGVISTLDLFTGAARAWVEDNVAFEPWQWLGECRLAIDPRSMESICVAMLDAGFTEG